MENKKVINLNRGSLNGEQLAILEKFKKELGAAAIYIMYIKESGEIISNKTGFSLTGLEVLREVVKKETEIEFSKAAMQKNFNEQ